MTLQEQYNQVKTGKGDKNHFLKQAIRQFPNYITLHNTFEQVETILQSKSLLSEVIVNKKGMLSESIGGYVDMHANTTTNWFKVFEAKTNDDVKADMKETDKRIIDLEIKDYDYKDEKNIDNLYGQAFLSGYYVEMEDPKNEDKTVRELKAIVAKNLAKDMTFYTTNSAFGLRIDGYQDDVPGAGKIVEPKGKYKQSGYGDLKK